MLALMVDTVYIGCMTPISGFRLPMDVKARLVELAQQTGQTATELVCSAIVAYSPPIVAEPAARRSNASLGGLASVKGRSKQELKERMAHASRCRWAAWRAKQNVRKSTVKETNCPNSVDKEDCAIDKSSAGNDLQQSSDNSGNNT